MGNSHFDPILANQKINSSEYEALYAESIGNNEAFWKSHVERLHWYKKPSQIKNVSFKKPVHISWFSDGELNLCFNCVDRHLPHKANDIALIWEQDEPSALAQRISYQKLFDEVNRWGNVYRKLGVKKGDRVTIYMPMIPEAAYAMLACARIGAIHSVIFGGFSAESIVDRVVGCESEFIVTADYGVRGGKIIPLKSNIDLALSRITTPVKVLVVQAGTKEKKTIAMQMDRDFWYHEVASAVSAECPCEVMNAEDPLFILYTSGSTNKPKGVLHTTGGYLLYAGLTFEKVFQYKTNDIYWCTADVGWVTGHSYLLYGPLSNGATTLMFEGVPHYPTASRFWEVIDKHQVNIFYTAPTALRSLMKEGDELVRSTSRKSLRILGSVGEPINPEAWLWYSNVVGEGRCPVIDTWWQTETGGILISPLPGQTKLKPGSATKPFFGIQPELLTPEGKVIHGEGEGVLALKDSWPGQMRTVYKDHARFEETYFSTYPGYYFTGDGCRRDEDGYYWITGRVDDVLNVSGHRIGTAEIESALVGHACVAEAAVVGYPHDIKGQGIYIYVTLKNGVSPSESLRKALIQWVRAEIGPLVTPDKLQWAPGLPKTRSGKIMRRILRKIAEGVFDNLGDISTLADPAVVEQLIQNRVS